MKTKENINRRGKASISSLNLIKKVAKVVVIIIGAIIGLVFWVFIRPILKGASWVISLITAILIIFWLLTL